MTHLDPNDPRFTAKALGEEEAQNINPEANEEFASLREFAQTLKSELKARDTEEALTAEQKERVRLAIEPKRKKLLKFPLWINAVAACLVLGLVGIVALKTNEDSRKPVLLPENAATKRPAVQSAAPPASSGKKEDLVELPKAEPEGNDKPRNVTVSETPASITTSANDENKRSLDDQRQRGLGEAEVFELTPFKIGEDADTGYRETTLTGTRLKTKLKDVGGSIPVITQEFLEDTAATDESEILQFAPTTEVSGNVAIFAEPQKAYFFPPQVQPPVFRQQEPSNREAYDRIVENAFKDPKDNPLSTFSIDVDTASYANVRRYLNNNQLPPVDAVRIEEMINYFAYDYAGPTDETPFAVHVDSATAPWNENHRLVRIALQGEKVDLSERPDANLVFLIDVSGSMSDQNKLPLVQRSLNLLVDQMEARDRIAVVVYAGASGLALPSTTANNKETIQHAISNLSSGGSTNGGAGIELAYSVAQKHFIKDGINRVILCTDGDFNVGTTDRGSLTRMIEEKAKSGVFFSVLGFGVGNYQDAGMEELSNKGNGNYGYVDSFKEARKVFVDDLLGTLHTIAKDVKIQVEFNPAHVGSYRLIGYENRMLAKEDFNDDKKDAGEIGAGHRVTALYEVIPTGLVSEKTPSVDALKYQSASEPAVASTEFLTVKLRYKQPDADVSQLIERPFIDSGSELAAASEDFRFATAVAGFGMLLRHSEFTETMTLADVLALANKAKGLDAGGLRSEFIELVEKAIQLTPKKETVPAGSQPSR